LALLYKVTAKIKRLSFWPTLWMGCRTLHSK